MSDSTNEAESNGKKKWFSEPTVAIYALLLTIIGINLGFFYHISSEISANGARIDANNARIDATINLINQINSNLGMKIDDVNTNLGMRIDGTNARIDGLQNLFTGLKIEFGIVKQNDENHDKLFEQQVQVNKEVFDRLAKLESAQEAESQ